MPLMPVTRPLKSANSMAARPMIAPPASADHGVNVVKSMFTARPRMPNEPFAFGADYTTAVGREAAPSKSGEK
jgi:hypothetical protein